RRTVDFATLWLKICNFTTPEPARPRRRSRRKNSEQRTSPVRLAEDEPGTAHGMASGGSKGRMNMSAPSPREWPETRRKIAILAATGGIGRQALEQAIAAGRDVTAVVRNPGNLAREVRTVVANLATVNPAALESAIAGADAVLSGLGARTNSEV